MDGKSAQFTVNKLLSYIQNYGKRTKCEQRISKVHNCHRFAQDKNMPTNTAVNIWKFLPKYRAAVFHHCHSPLIWLHHTHLYFPNLNLKFQVCQCDTVVAIPYNMMEKLHTITEDKFSKCFQSLHICCKSSFGDFLKRDG